MATLKQIAKETGFSTATVSYVLNDGPRGVSPETREKVLEAMKRLNYRPNAAARRLRGKRTNTLGVVFPHAIAAPFDNSYFAPIIAGVLDVATERQFACMLYSGLDWETVEANSSLYGDGRCDGLIVVAVPKQSPLIRSLHNYGIPYVLVGTQTVEYPAATVDTDNVKGALLATRHLLDLGHRRIGMLQGNDNSSSNDERTHGFVLAHEERGLTVDRSLLFPSAYQADSAYASACTALDVPADFRATALFCANDMMASMAYQAAAERGLHIPRDLSIVGFDDYSFSSTMSPPLTTIAQPLRHIGASAANNLLELLRDSACPPSQFRFEPELRLRSSTSFFPHPDLQR